MISAIRRSQNVDTARNNLMRNFDFTQVQAQAILDMQLRRLAALERRKLQDEFKELQKQIAYLEDILANPAKILSVIKDDLIALKEKYGDARRTQIVDRTKGTLTSTDLLPEQDVWVSVSASGDLRRQDMSKLTATTLRQIGKGSEVELLAANTRDFLYLFCRDGRCRRVAIHEIPQNGENKHLAELTDFTRRDDITTAIVLPRVVAEEAQGYLFLVTEQGTVKRVTLADFLDAVAGDPSVMNVDEKDRLRWVLHTKGEQEVILVSAGGQSIRFSEEDVRAMGLAAGGVGGMKLKKGDIVIYAAVVDPGGELLTVTQRGYAKHTPLDQYSSQGRYGGGIATHKTNSRTGHVTTALMLPALPPVELAVLLKKGGLELVELTEIPQMGRSVQGKQIVELQAGDAVVAVKAVTEAPSVTPPDGDDGRVIEQPVVARPISTTQNGAANGRAGHGAVADRTAQRTTKATPKAQATRTQAPPAKSKGVPSQAKRSNATAAASQSAASESPPASVPKRVAATGPKAEKAEQAAAAETKSGASSSGSKRTKSKASASQTVASESSPVRSRTQATPAKSSVVPEPKAKPARATARSPEEPNGKNPKPAVAAERDNQRRPQSESKGAKQPASSTPTAKPQQQPLLDPEPAQPKSRRSRSAGKVATVTSVRRTQAKKKLDK